MKKALILISILYTSISFGQDTIRISEINPSYLVFSTTIEFVDIGNKDEYDGKIEDKVLLIKAKHLKAGNSTLLIRSADSFYHYILSYEKNPKNYYYDFTGATIGGEAKQKEKTPGKQSLELIQNKVDSIINIKGELNTLGVISDYLQAAATVIRNDKENTYIKVVIKNLSSIPYEFNFIGFQYVQVMKKGMFKKTKNAPKDVFPIIYPKKKEINANSTDVIAYAIPQFGLANDGYLVISFREKKGDRVLLIKIDSSVIQGAKYFNY